MMPTPRLLVVVLTGFLCAVLVVSAWVVFPPSAGDETTWMVTALNHRAGNGAVNKFNWRVWSENPPAEGAMNYYPLLYVFLLSGTMVAPTYPAMMMGIALLKSVALILLTWGWLRLASRGTPAGRWALACVGAGVCAQFVLLYGSSRAELGVVLVLSILVLLVSFGVRGPLVWGVALGLVAGNNPMCGLLLAGVAALFFARELKSIAAVRAILVAGAVSLAVFLGVLAAGWGIAETLRVTAAASQEQFYDGFDAVSSLRYFFAQKNALFAGLPGCVAFVALAAIPFSLGVRSRLLYGAGFLCLTAVVVQAALLKPERVYNVFAFTPLVVALLLVLGRTSPLWRVSGTVSLGLAGAGAVVPLVALGLHLGGGVRFEVARREWLRASADGKVGAGELVASTTSLWGLSGSTEDLGRFRALSGGGARWTPDALRKAPILVQQMFGADLVPNRTEPPRTLKDPRRGIDHVLVVDLFNRDVPRVMGVPVGQTVPGWGFALYLPRVSGAQAGAAGNSRRRGDPA